ncbi:MAG: 2-oxoacid:ferredoxin oxidoreductase subunit beta [Deltaproteobacteria bacterium]|nr:2-oxoacid:ferredoxin oxidoreductase subunit beta [Deltaproteobacteria bacterium]MBW2283777.1 2-oxoacid:ferredoxin oxidoreductase subunit beta [Deltaproteobacteria bacterium]
MKTPGNVLADKVEKIKASGDFSIRSENLPTWCPGCGYFGIHQGLNNAIQRLGLPHHDVVTVTGIGCAGRYAFFTHTYTLHTAHGRTLPVATGVKLAQPELTVFAVGGDGDGLGIGGGHLPHIARRDVDVNYLLFDNSIYGLTKGQPSPSSPVGTRTKVSPEGSTDAPLNGTLMALSYGASFVARLFAGDPESITEALVQGIRHKGFSFFHLYTSCVTFDKSFKTWDHLKARTHPLPPEHDPGNLKQAMGEALDDPYSLGIIYRREGGEMSTV